MQRVTFCLIGLTWFCPLLPAYSVLTHQAIIDAAWEAGIQPALLQRYPALTPEDLRKAHAYAYGGCMVQDMGYYPFGSRFFSDLVHYARSGDFVANLLREAQDPREYAFALGGLAHYVADTQGHSIAVNRAVPVEYPKLRRKYGDVITYEDDPGAHLKVEFGFDVLQIARGSYAPEAYHDFIGFEVAQGVLDRAFRRTYSMELKDVFTDFEVALATYRKAVSTVIPGMTKAAWAMKREELEKRGVSESKFVYRLSRAGYRREWGGRYREPGIGYRILAFVLRLLPKIGPLRALAFHPPGQQAEALFAASFTQTVDQYRGRLREEQSDSLWLENRDFDTGQITRPTEYRMADDAYSKLAIQLAKKPPGSIEPALVADVLRFYRDPELPYATKRHGKAWRDTLAALAKLKLQALAAAR